MLPARYPSTDMDRSDIARLIAIVDDDDSVRVAIEGVVRSVGYAAESFASAEEFLASASGIAAACVIADVQMPGLGGLGLQKALRSEARHTPIIFMTAFDAPKIRADAMRAGAVAFLRKPFDDNLLIDAIHAAAGDPPTIPKDDANTPNA